MLAVAGWYVVVLVAGLLVVPLAWRLFPRLPDRGFGATKILGVLLLGTVFWLATSYGLVRNEPGGAALVTLGVGAASLSIGWPGLRRRGRGGRPVVVWIRRHLGYVAAVEALFLGVFVTWAAVRAHIPAAQHTEQPMDLLFLTAVMTSPTAPPPDPWLAGFPIAYYYLGYWLLGTLGQLAGVPAAVAYNVGQACWLGLLVTGCFALGANLAVLGARPAGPRPVSRALVGGLLTAVAVALTSNLPGAIAGVKASVAMVFRRSPLAIHAASTTGEETGAWWWWASSRVLRDADLSGRPLEVIDEFPAFSYLLGDNHPHVLAMPITVLLIAAALDLFLAARAPVAGARTSAGLTGDVRRALPIGVPGLVVLVVIAGTLLAVNPWDFPAGWLLLVLAVAVGRHPAPPASRAGIPMALWLLIGALLVALPYLVVAQSQVRGIRPNLFHPTASSQVLSMFGTVLPGLGLLCWLGGRAGPMPWRRIAAFLVAGVTLAAAWMLAGALWAFGTGPGRDWLAALAPPAGLAPHAEIVLARWRGAWPTAALLTALAAILWALLGARSPARRDAQAASDPARRFAVLLASVGTTLVLLPELAYVADVFGTRMNTVFKLYYQAWLLLGVSSAYATLSALRERGPVRAAGGLSAAVLLAGTVYLVAGVHDRVAAGTRPPTLDALAYLEAEDPDELTAIRWILAQTAPHARVIQGAGTSYHADEGRVSVATGRPTLLGWVGHELQWRGSAFAHQTAGRDAALTEIYAGSDPGSLRHLLERWAVDYVYVGARERARYGITAAAEERLRTVMELVFERGPVRIYRRRG